MTLKKLLEDLGQRIETDGDCPKSHRKIYLKQLEQFKVLLDLYGERDEDAIWCDVDAHHIGDHVYPDHQWMLSIIPGMRQCRRCHAVEVKEAVHGTF